MEKEKLIDKIKANFILNGIFDYIQDTNFKLKLFIHSKSNQKKLDLELVIYKDLYLNKIGFDLDYYLYSKYNKEFLNKNYQNFYWKIILIKKNLKIFYMKY